MSTRTPHAALSLLLFAAVALGCTDTAGPAARATAASSPPPASNATGTSPDPATATPATGAAPANVRLEGRLPDLTTPVPLGEGEAGRLTVRWEGGAGARGFRVYVKDCDGTVRPPIEVAPTDHQFGPLQACRPSGNIGVAAVYAGGESSIAWVR